MALTKRQTTGARLLHTLFVLTLLSSAAHAALPQVDFDRMGKVALAGAFAGLDFFNNATAVTYDSSTSTLLSRTSEGALSRIGATNIGGRISAGCALNDVFYAAGSFSSLGGTSAANIASYTQSSNQFAALGSNGPNGEIYAIYCDEKGSKVWVGGQFTAPGSAVAVWDTKANVWSQAPFGGLSGAAAEVYSITTNSSASSLFFAGSFIASFQGNVTTLNNTNNPNVPYSSGATPFSSSLVPIPLLKANINASPSSTESGFTNITNVLCPAGADGPGNSWFAQDGITSVINVQTYMALSASGIRLGNTFQSGHGTTGFSVESLPDNQAQMLTYIDPTTGQNATCSNLCPLLTDPTIPYQDFIFSGASNLTGVQIKLSQWTGSSAGLHILQLLSSGAFASAVDSQNGQSCYAPNPSNTSLTGVWTDKEANTNIAGTVQSVLVSMVDVGTSPASGPSFTWMPYVSASGQYDINMLVPGCSDFEDCALRTSVKVTVFPGGGQNPTVTTVSQQNKNDESILIYSGPVVPSASNFVTTVTMTLADSPAGKGQRGKYELVADRVQLVLTSANITSGTSGSNGTSGTSGSQNSFGFLEWPLSSTTNTTNPASLLNSTETSLDAAGFELFKSLGGATALASTNAPAVAAVAFHSSGAVFLGGNFTLSSGTASTATNIVVYRNGALAGLANAGLNGPVTSLVIDGDDLYVGGSFTGTQSGSTQGLLRGVAMYNVQQNQWAGLEGGVNGAVTSLGSSNGQIQLVGNFTSALNVDGSTSGMEAAGFAVWNVSSSIWANSGGFLVGSMTLITNSTINDQNQSQFLAGSVQASLKYGTTSLVMLTNGDNDGPNVVPLGVPLNSAGDSSLKFIPKRSKANHRRGASAWIPTITLAHLFPRQSTRPSPLPTSPVVTAPAILTGVFWTNSSTSKEVAIIGGNFSFSSGSSQSQGIAIYDQQSSTITPLQGTQLNGTVRSLLVEGSFLYVGGDITLAGTDVNGLAIYDLATQQWAISDLPPLQSASGISVSVRSVTASPAYTNVIIVAGIFAQAGSLTCQGICSWDTSAKQWTSLGAGIQGQVSAVTYAGSNDDQLIASGSIALSDNTIANVAQYSFANTSWKAIGSSSDIPGPVTAIEVDNGNETSIFAAGRTTEGSSTFLIFWNGEKWTNYGSSLESTSNIAQLVMVPLQKPHAANGIIEPDRMLLVSGSLVDTSFGTASSALFDGSTFIPYIMSSSSTGIPGLVSSLFYSLSSFTFTQRHFLAVGVVILISIAIAAGVVFLMALIGILWTLFSRRDDKMGKFEGAEDDDNSSAHHRPSSLLDHINAATRNTILGTPATFGMHSEKDEALGDKGTENLDPFAADGGNYIRAETPSDAVGGGTLAAEEESRPAHARYSFDGAGEGELPLTAGIEVEVLDDRDAAWWYARDPASGREGVVPAAYLY